MITGTEAEYQSDAGSTKDTHTYGVGFFVTICEKIDRVITELYVASWSHTHAPGYMYV